jgi:hypothetical protein
MVIHQRHLRLRGQYLVLVVLIPMKRIKILTMMIGKDGDSDNDSNDDENNSECNYAPRDDEESDDDDSQCVIHIVIPNSSIVHYWKMKNPLNPIV